ncbi:MAG: beta-lactamase family protein [Planctomyces sp.]|nr:beta-lactamase family protein [Planctomyces sp.]
MDSIRLNLESVCRRYNLPVLDIEAGSCDEASISFAWSHGQTLKACPPRRFLVASITKPIVGMLAIQFAEHGCLGMNDRVLEYLPEFDCSTLRRITIRHLLTHTCGLPDMLPENQELRRQHAPLQAYVAATANCQPEFSAGVDCRYSSMGFAVLGAILERVSGKSLQVLVADHIFQPLQMTSSWLGLPESDATTLMPTIEPCELPVWQSQDSNWNWNSLYWRTLGAPWGGMISTVADLGMLARMMLRHGVSGENQVLSPVGIRLATSHQTRWISGLPASVADTQRWGLGWRLNWPDHPASFGDFVSPDAYGHWGATGTMIWIDPAEQTYCVILTTRPYEQSAAAIRSLSNIAAAMPKL